MVTEHACVNHCTWEPMSAPIPEGSGGQANAYHSIVSVLAWDPLSLHGYLRHVFEEETEWGFRVLVLLGTGLQAAGSITTPRVILCSLRRKPSPKATVEILPAINFCDRVLNSKEKITSWCSPMEINRNLCRSWLVLAVCKGTQPIEYTYD